MLRFLALVPLMAVLALANAYAGGEKKEDGEKPPPPKKKKFDPQEIWDRIDANHDKKITKKEWLDAKDPRGKDGDDDEKGRAFREKMFAEIDNDSDGVITPAEWKTFGEEMKAKFGKKKKDRDDDEREKKDKD